MQTRILSLRKTPIQTNVLPLSLYSRLLIASLSLAYTCHVPLGANEVEFSVGSESAPLRIDDHVTRLVIISVPQLHVLNVLFTTAVC